MKTNRFPNSSFVLHPFRWLLPLLLPAHFASPGLAAPGDVDAGFNPNANRTVFSVAVQADGKIVIGGEFTMVGEMARSSIARLNSDGRLDAMMNPVLSARLFPSVESMAIQSDGKIVIAGSFTAVEGTTRTNFARLNSDGTLDLGFDPNVNGTVISTTMQADGKIVIGGGFTMVGGVARTNLARLNPDGTLEPGFSLTVNNVVLNTAEQADGKVIIAGAFTTVAGMTRNHVARLNNDGTLDVSFNPNVNGIVYSTAVQADGKAVIGGDFTTVGGMTLRRIARLNTDGTPDLAFDPNANDWVLSTAVQADGKIVIVGGFATVGGVARNRIARINADGTLDSSFNPNVGGPIAFNTVVQADGKILISGQFITVGGMARTNFARLANDAATQSLTVPGASRIEWLRGGASPEAQYVTFELSTDGGTTWSPLGTGTRIPSGWELTALTLPTSGQVRGHARVNGGYFNGSAGLVEAVTAYSLASVSSPRLVGPSLLSNGAFQFAFTNLSGVPFTALAMTNLTLPSSNWTVLGPATEIFPGQFQFTDLAATNFPYRLYQIRSP